MKVFYGTVEQAAEHLKDMATFFDPKAIPFIQQYQIGTIMSAVNLGCGPGFTTHMLAQATGCMQTYGLDSNDQLLKMAQQNYPNLSFVKHDMTAFPFPVQSDLIYARFLLSQMDEAPTLINLWSEQLSYDGVLIVEEIEEVNASKSVFKKFLAINSDLIANQAVQMYAGETIARGRYDHQVLLNEAVHYPIPNWIAAGWFYHTTMTMWREEPFIRKRTTGKERRSIRETLLDLTDLRTPKSDATWVIRRLVIKR
jgi:SAM-dependent methyltransferase